MLFSGVQVHSYANVEDSMLLPNVDVGRGCVLKKCIIDKNTVIPPGMQIGVDHVQDKKRFRVTDSGITLVTKEMLGQTTEGLR
jgi:glucose-1-phosphate adenylyltransferase